MSATKPVTLGLAAAVALILAGCGGASGTADPAPATLKPVAGSRVQQVQLSATAVHRLGIQTQPVRPAGGARPGHAGVLAGRASAGTVVPYSAVVYDTDGSTWTYVNTSGRTFVRDRITVAAIEGRSAMLSTGPHVGARVVTVGAPELLGAEYDISGEE
ncbi:MAG TPA: hypothetical protein VGH77_19515 [Streptosporangiaceae bacterium]